MCGRLQTCLRASPRRRPQSEVWRGQRASVGVGVAQKGCVLFRVLVEGVGDEGDQIGVPHASQAAPGPSCGQACALAGRCSRRVRRIIVSRRQSCESRAGTRQSAWHIVGKRQLPLPGFKLRPHVCGATAWWVWWVSGDAIDATVGIKPAAATTIATADSTAPAV